ncbi:MAG: hypothetical protein AAF489_17035 [Bacteroidota bacterium]
MSAVFDVVNIVIVDLPTNYDPPRYYPEDVNKIMNQGAVRTKKIKVLPKDPIPTFNLRNHVPVYGLVGVDTEGRLMLDPGHLVALSCPPYCKEAKSSIIM